MDESKLSPMMKQYLAVKRTCEDKILFYRLGDFYEMFFDDALTVSRELDLTLTGKVCGLPERAPMCGVPFHSADSYIARLIEKGYSVAICEQMEDPATAKGIVRREIIRIITPGTVTDADMLPEGRNNYLASVFLLDGQFGVCFADVSTGQVQVTEGEGGASLLAELTRFQPAEVLINTGADPNGKLAAFCKKQFGADLHELYENYHIVELNKEYILGQFDRAMLSELKPFEKGFAVRALGAMIKYLSETQMQGVGRLVSLRSYAREQFMSIGQTARRNLELTETLRARDKRGSLLWVLDRTSTAMGRRLLRSHIEKPLVDPAAINERLDACAELTANNILLGKTEEALSGISDLERVMTRVAYGSCTPRDMLSIAETARRLKLVKGFSRDFRCAYLKRIDRELDPLSDLLAEIERTIDPDASTVMKDGGYIRSGFSQEIDELHALLTDTRSYLAAMEAELKQQTGIRQLKIGYNRVFGYYIEVSKSNLSMVPDSFIRKQTLTTGERYVTEELKQLEEKILGASERSVRLEREIFEKLRLQLLDALRRVQLSAAAVARLDVVCSHAECALTNNYVRPAVNGGDRIEILAGRHPVVERIQSDSLFVPNDCLLDCGEFAVSIITGPNMAGKSTYMRQVALIALMAQIGAFVPARSATIGVIDSIFTRIGASDDLSQGQSTFMVEMNEVAEILRCATARSLLILDEVGRGTSTYDGMSIAWAVIEYIAKNIGAKTLFATHYHELTDLEGELPCVKNYNVAVKKRGDDITFLRRIVRGAADESFGIEVAKLAGLPEALTDRARQILSGIEKAAGLPQRRAAARVVSDPLTESEREAVNELKATDIESLTPIEAMVRLHDVIKRLRSTENE